MNTTKALFSELVSWLAGETGKEILLPFPAVQMKAWAISPRVNSPRNNDPAIMAPADLVSQSLVLLAQMIDVQLLISALDPVRINPLAKKMQLSNHITMGTRTLHNADYR